MSTSGIPVPDEATLAQMRAARPGVSTWLSANAGSGKTRVLTDRVARLLLAQVPPERILCLTYTKAAASEMQNRLFKRLGEWAMLPDAELRRELTKLGEDGAIDSTDLRRARTLFAAAIEAPGGLKIQTIHSFCSSVLRRFPLEAGVSPQFTEMDDRAAARLRSDVIEDMASRDEEAALIQTLAEVAGVSDLDALAKDVISLQGSAAPCHDPAQIRSALGLRDDQTEGQLLADLLDPATKAMLGRVADGLSTTSASYKTAAARIKSVDLAAPTRDSIAPLVKLFTYADGSGAKIGKYPQANHKAARAAIEADLPALDDFMERLETTLDHFKSLDDCTRIAALGQFAATFATRYDAAKAQLGWLDFDDLILKTRALLSDKAVAAWVLYRLDGGIDHVLVDEAQDTSPAQWDVIKHLIEDFMAGDSARTDVPRTIFVVGDKKQSIYSFQGADAREFDETHAVLKARLAATNHGLAEAELQYSFRSAQCILELVDRTFADQTSAGFASGNAHRAFNGGPPGRIDVWPLLEGEDAPESDASLTDTLDKPAPNDPRVMLAQHIASEIKRMTGADGGPGEMIHDGDSVRRVTAGDFLVLVQSRSTLFDEIIRACKAEQLAIAGADRLKVGAELAVRDIQALLNFLALPEDDFSLAVALKSPLFGWDEQRLYTAARHRGAGYLWAHLRENPDHYPRETAVLHDLRDNADFLRPYDLIERILTRHMGRQRIIGRLGAEAEDGIDALLAQALSYEQTQIPSLTGFVTWMEADDLTIKRQLDQGRDEIRVMTVHGAKGLEAPIVIMPDTAKRQGAHNATLLNLDGMLTWNTANADAPSAILTAKEAAKQKDAEERMRLLYVAMTRAEKWLILAAAGKLGNDPEDSWYGMIERAAMDMRTQEAQFPTGAGLRIEPMVWGPLTEAPQAHVPPTPPEPLAPAMLEAPPPPRETAFSLSPSDLGGAKALPGEAGLDEDAAMTYGTQIHVLLEHLPNHPPDHWPDITDRLIDPVDRMTGVLEEARRVLTATDLQFLWDAAALNEVPVTAPLDALGGRSILGIIDKLILGDEIWIVDFKSNKAVPSTAERCPDGIARQMGAYRAAIAQIYPHSPIRSAILWTHTAELMELPEPLTSTALHRAGAHLTIDAAAR